MSLKIRSLADGPVPTTLNDLLPVVAAGKAVIVRNMRFVNTGSGNATLNVYFKNAAATSRRVLPKDLLLPPGFCLIDDQEITLEVGDKIEGLGTGSTVDYVISGVEREQT